MWVVITLVAMVCTPLGAQAHHSFAVFDIDNKMEECRGELIMIGDEDNGWMHDSTVEISEVAAP